jgi:hypothetical protein
MDYRTLDLVWRALISGGLFLAALGLALWVYWASEGGRRGALLWRLAVTATALLTLPSLVLSAFNLDQSAQRWINPLFYLSLFGAVATVAATAAFALTARGRTADYDEFVPEWQGAAGAAGTTQWDEPGQPWAEPAVAGYAADPRPAVAAGGGGWTPPAGASGFPPIDEGPPTPAWPGPQSTFEDTFDPRSTARPAVGGGGTNPTVLHGSPPSGRGRAGSSETVMIDPPSTAVALAYLVERNGPRPGRPYQLKAHTLLGRGEGNSIRIDDPTVTDRHASVRHQPDGIWLLTDLDSANGTFLLKPGASGEVPERIHQHPLREPDVIRLGGREFIFMEVRPEDDAANTSGKTTAVPAQDLSRRTDLATMRLRRDQEEPKDASPPPGGRSA